MQFFVFLWCGIWRRQAMPHYYHAPMTTDIGLNFSLKNVFFFNLANCFISEERGGFSPVGGICGSGEFLIGEKLSVLIPSATCQIQ